MLIEILKRGKTDTVSCNASRNPNCPSEMLIEVLKRGNDDWVSRDIADNPNCPFEALVEVLKRGNDDNVSFYAFRNPSCPTEVKIKWMQAVGRIGKEDSSKHIIEYENKKEDDFQDLKDLL